MAVPRFVRTALTGGAPRAGVPQIIAFATFEQRPSLPTTIIGSRAPNL